MTATDAPDWQTVVQIVSSGTVTDAPDWQTVVTAPGGGSIGFGIYTQSVFLLNGVTIPSAAAEYPVGSLEIALNPGYVILYTSWWVTDTSGSDNLVQALITDGSSILANNGQSYVATLVPAGGQAAVTQFKTAQVTTAGTVTWSITCAGSCVVVGYFDDPGSDRFSTTTYMNFLSS